MLGSIVKVIVDRPLGSYHPKYKDMYYPINYGFIEGVMASDGEEQDAYILGVDVPIKEFVGKIIAIIHRYDDVEEKWVVAPESISFAKEEIMKQVEFQEKYFKSEVIEWEFPNFSVDRCFAHLLKMQKMVEDKGSIEGTIHHYLIVAKK